MELQCQMDVINLYQCDPGFHTGKRIFPYHYLLYVHNGKGIYQIGSRRCPAKMGDLFYCPPGMANDIIADPTDPFLLSGIEFRCNDDIRLVKSLPEVENILPEPFLGAVIREMVREYSYGMTSGHLVCSHLLNILVLRLLRVTPGGMRGKKDTISALLDYIRENLDREVTHAELSREFSYHKNSINRLLREATGMSLKNYQIALRIKQASVLLTYSDKPIREIAELCGYQNSAFFSRQFREKTGITPLQFRKEGHYYLKNEQTAFI